MRWYHRYARYLSCSLGGGGFKDCVVLSQRPRVHCEWRAVPQGLFPFLSLALCHVVISRLPHWLRCVYVCAHPLKRNGLWLVGGRERHHLAFIVIANELRGLGVGFVIHYW